MSDIAYVDMDAMDRIFKAMQEGASITLQNDDTGEWVHFPADVLSGAEWYVTKMSKLVEQTGDSK